MLNLLAIPKSNPTPSLSQHRLRFLFKGQKCGNTGSPCLYKPVFGQAGGGGDPVLCYVGTRATGKQKSALRVAYAGV